MVAQSQFIEQIGDSRSNPRKWDVFTLKEIVLPSCPISYGIVQPGDDLPDGVPIVRPVDLDETHVVTSKGLKKTSKEISEAYKRTVLKGDELLLCVRGTTGLVGLATPELKGCNVTRGITPLAFKDSIDRVFMLCMFLSDGIQEFIADNTIGSALRGINMSVIRDMKIPVPPLDVQKHFARLYKQADKSKFDDLKSQFIEILNSSEKKVEIGDVLLLASKGKTPQYVEHSNVRVMNQACVHWDGIHWENVKYQDPGKLSNKEALKSFDILLNSTGTGTLGRCNIFFKPDDEYTYIPDGHLTVLKTNQSIMRPWLLVYFIKLEDVQREIYDDCVTGSTNQVDLVRKNFLRIRIPLPEMALQMRFDKIVSQADKSKYLS